jgi:hypothetical protein
MPLLAAHRARDARYSPRRLTVLHAVRDRQVRWPKQSVRSTVKNLFF